ncbi:MAG: DsbA family protein [Burkholderiaceae bacterium]
MTTLIYIADPMCSWCYGFGPELSALMQGLPELPVEVVVGGLRPYNTQPMDEELKTTLLSHWHNVAEKTGLPFMDDALTREGFIYNTEPACRAVVTARKLAPFSTLAMFQAIQHAFYASGMDITRIDVLSEIGASVLTKMGVPTDAAAFEAVLTSEESIMATHDDFALTQKWGINGFPTLVLERDGKLDLVTSGYVEMPLLVEHMQAIIDKSV